MGKNTFKSRHCSQSQGSETPDLSSKPSSELLRWLSETSSELDDRPNPMPPPAPLPPVPFREKLCSDAVIVAMFGAVIRLEKRRERQVEKSFGAEVWGGNWNVERDWLI